MKELVSCDEATVEALKARLKRAATIAEFQRVQFVLMRAVLGYSAGEIAQVLGWAVASQHRGRQPRCRRGKPCRRLALHGSRPAKHPETDRVRLDYLYITECRLVRKFKHTLAPQPAAMRPDDGPKKLQAPTRYACGVRCKWPASHWCLVPGR